MSSIYKHKYLANPGSQKSDFLSNANVYRMINAISILTGKSLGYSVTVHPDVVITTASNVLLNIRADNRTKYKLVTEHISDYIVTEKLQEKQNNERDPWVQKYDGSHGIVRHQKVKINNRRNKLGFSMMY